MPALNFQKRFADKILSGEKQQTIRKDRKRPIKIGDTLYLYTGLRTPKAKKLKEVECIEVSNIEIDLYYFHINCGDHQLTTNAYYMSALNSFAQDDGFEDWVEMVQWFEKNHGLPFKGQIIYWDDE